MTQEKATAQRFRVSTHDNGYYCVSIPKYEGGDVVNAADYDALLSEVAQLKSALSDYVKFSDEAALLLDEDKDAKCLKLLLAMAGRAPKYRADVDAAHALREGKPPE